jgi:hypothetical protein
MFSGPLGEAWAAQRFAPLDDASIEARLDALKVPGTARALLRVAPTWARTFEGRRNEYISRLTALARDIGQAPARTRKAFPFCARHTAAPDLDEVVWTALSDDEASRELARLRAKFGFDEAEDGTIPLCDYGDGLRGLLVVSGAQTGAVWTFDTENLILSPGLPRAARTAPDDDRGPSFEQWFCAWLASVERDIECGPKRRGARLWA